MTAPEAKSPRKRLSIQFGPALSELLDSGNCSGATVAARLDVLAQRYLALTGQPPQWSAETWTAAIAAARKVDLTHPASPFALGGVVRQDRPDPKLNYAFESVTPAMAFAVIGVAERFLATGEPVEPERVAAFLDQAGIAFQRA